MYVRNGAAVAMSGYCSLFLYYTLNEDTFLVELCDSSSYGRGDDQ